MLTIIFYHASFFLIIDLDFSILAVMIKMMNPVAKLAMPIGIPTKEAKAKMETHQPTVELK